MPLKARISRSMTILRDKDSGGLTLVNSMRLSEEGLRQLEALGPIEHVIRLASMHGADDAFYQERYGAKVYALEGTHYTPGLSAKVDPNDSYFTPDVTFETADDLPLSDATVYVFETPHLKDASILLHRDGGILLSGDFFHNTPKPDEFTNWRMGFMMRLFGLAKPCNMGVAWVMMTKPSKQALLSLLEIPFDHVLPIHGLPVIGDAKERYRPAIERFAQKAK